MAIPLSITLLGTLETDGDIDSLAVNIDRTLLAGIEDDQIFYLWNLPGLDNVNGGPTDFEFDAGIGGTFTTGGVYGVSADDSGNWIVSMLYPGGAGPTQDEVIFRFAGTNSASRTELWSRTVGSGLFVAWLPLWNPINGEIYALSASLDDERFSRLDSPGAETVLETFTHPYSNWQPVPQPDGSMWIAGPNTAYHLDTTGSIISSVARNDPSSPPAYTPDGVMIFDVAGHSGTPETWRYITDAGDSEATFMTEAGIGYGTATHSVDLRYTYVLELFTPAPDFDDSSRLWLIDWGPSEPGGFWSAMWG